MGTHPIFESDFDCLTEMGDERTRCICNFTHHTAQMICCDGCGVWQHAECMNIDKKMLQEYEKNDREYLCEKCKPRELDYERAKKLQQEWNAQQEKIRRRRTRPESGTHESNSTENGSTDDDESGYRRPSRDERKAIELEKIFQKMSRDEIKRSRKREERSGGENVPTSSKEKDSDDSDKGHEIENEDSEEENEEQNAGTPRNRKENPNGKKRGRPKGSVSKKKKTDEEEGKEKRGRKIKVSEDGHSGVSPTNIPDDPGRISRPGRRPGRKPRNPRGPKKSGIDDDFELGFGRQ